MLSAGVTFVRSTPAPASIRGRIVRWNVADIEPDEEGNYAIQIEVKVDPALAPESQDSPATAQSTTNCASLLCQTSDDEGQRLNTDCVTDEISLPQLDIEKIVREPSAEPGKTLEFEIIVTNSSDVTAYTVTIEDHNPAGFIYLKNSVRSWNVEQLETVDTQPLVWVLNDLRPGASARLTYTVQLDREIEQREYVTTLKAYAVDRAGAQFETEEFELTLKVASYMLLTVAQSLREAGQDIQAGVPLTVVTTIENIGSGSLTGGAIFVMMPKDFEYVAGSSLINDVPISDPVHSGQKFIWQLGEVAPESVVRLEYQVQGAEGTTGIHVLRTEVFGASDTGEAYQSKEDSLVIPLSP
jgi:uncharacterized repeat protein (TIGR01451 family)